MTLLPLPSVMINVLARVPVEAGTISENILCDMTSQKSTPANWGDTLMTDGNSLCTICPQSLPPVLSQQTEQRETSSVISLYLEGRFLIHHPWAYALISGCWEFIFVVEILKMGHVAVMFGWADGRLIPVRSWLSTTLLNSGSIGIYWSLWCLSPYFNEYTNICLALKSNWKAVFCWALSWVSVSNLSCLWLQTASLGDGVLEYICTSVYQIKQLEVSKSKHFRAILLKFWPLEGSATSCNTDIQYYHSIKLIWWMY